MLRIDIARIDCASYVAKTGIALGLASMRYGFVRQAMPIVLAMRALSVWLTPS